MNESRFKRIISAVTAGAVLLIVFLISLLIYQLVSIFNTKKEIRMINDQIATYNELTEEQKKELSKRQTKEWLKYRALELGYVDKDGNVLNK